MAIVSNCYVNWSMLSRKKYDFSNFEFFWDLGSSHLVLSNISDSRLKSQKGWKSNGEACSHRVYNNRRIKEGYNATGGWRPQQFLLTLPNRYHSSNNW